MHRHLSLMSQLWPSELGQCGHVFLPKALPIYISSFLSSLALQLPPSRSAPRPRSRSASHTKFMKVLSARGAERRPIPRAAALSRAAPPSKVFSLHLPPGTILGPRPTKYLPQSSAGRRATGIALRGPAAQPPPVCPSRLEVIKRSGWNRVPVLSPDDKSNTPASFPPRPVSLPS